MAQRIRYFGNPNPVDEDLQPLAPETKLTVFQGRSKTQMTVGNLVAFADRLRPPVSYELLPA